MAILANESFEAGVLNAAIDEIDTIFSDVSTQGITYVTGLDGTSLACNVNPTATGSCRNSGFTPMGVIVIRLLFKFSSAPEVSNIAIANMCSGDPNAGGVRVANLYLTPDRRIQVRNVFTTVATTAMQFDVNTEYALEWRFNGDTQNQRLRVFTNVAQTSDPVESIGPVAANAGPTTIDWVQVGKLTSAIWPGGFTFDKYKRADDWISSATVTSRFWDLEWVGTDGNDISIPVGWAKEGANTTTPKYDAGGPNVDQSVLIFPGQSSNNRRLLSPAIPLAGYTDERFYIQMNGKPELPEEHQTIWSAGGSTVRLFRLVAAAGIGNYYDLQLWSDDDWDPTLPEQEPGFPPNPSPLGVLTELAIDTFHRIEIRISASAGPATCTVSLWKGIRRNSTSTPDQVISGDCVGTASLDRRRYGQDLHGNVANTVLHRGVSFDSMVLTQDGPTIGPLDLEDQYDPPLVSQWTFYEWDGQQEIPLTLAGASTGGATLEEVNIGDTSNPPKPSDKLFTADPGLGKKLYATADSNGSPRYDVIANLYNFEMRTLSAGVNHPASDRCAPGCYRSFEGASWGAGAMPSYSSHGASSWDEHRRAAANTAISSWSIDCINATYAQGIYNGDYNSWLRNTLAPYLKDIYERYGHLFIFDLANEPDAGDTPSQHTPLYLARIRRAVRYIHFFLLNEGVPEEAFMVSNGTTFAQMAADHDNAHKVAVNTTDTSWPNGIRGDALYYWIADWKGTRTVANGYWSDAYDPNPVDFIQPGEMDQWGYGSGPVVRMYSTNWYDRQYEHLNTLNTLAKFRANVPSIAGSGYGRVGNLFRFNKALWGGASPVLNVSSANANGIPIFIGEMGLGVWNPLPYTSNPAEPGPTADAYCEVFMKDLVEKCNVVAYAKWRYEPSIYNSGGNSPGGSFTHHYKTNGLSRGGNLWDPTNSNTKAEAAIFNTQYVADPPAWPDATPRPPYVSINGGAKRDYRGINDVP